MFVVNGAEVLLDKPPPENSEEGCRAVEVGISCACSGAGALGCMKEAEDAAKGFGFAAAGAGVAAAKPSVENNEVACVADGAAVAGVPSFGSVSGLEMEKGNGEGANGLGALETGAAKGLEVCAAVAGVIDDAAAPEKSDAKGFGFTVAGAGVAVAKPPVEDNEGGCAATGAAVRVSSFETASGLEVEKGDGEGANEFGTNGVVAGVVVCTTAPDESDAKGFGCFVV